MSAEELPDTGEWVVVYDAGFGMSRPQWSKAKGHLLSGIEVDLLDSDGDVVLPDMYFAKGEFARLGGGIPASWDGDADVEVEDGPHGRPSITERVESSPRRGPAETIYDLAREDMDTAVAKGQAAAGRHPASQIFHDILVEMGDLHDRKQADYGSPTDPFANVRGSTAFGISPWVGAIVRANDKMNRLQAAARGQNLVNESIEDSLLDLAVYAIIGLVLFRQENEELADIGHGD